MKGEKEKFVLFRVEFPSGMPDLTGSPGDTPIPIKFYTEKGLGVVDGIPNIDDWDDKRQGMMLFLMILANHHQKYADPSQPLTVQMADDALARVREVESTYDSEPRAVRRAMRLAADGQYERAGALLRKYTEAQFKAQERARLAEVGAKLSAGLEISRAKAKKVRKDAAQSRHQEWQRIGMPLRTARPDMPDSQLADTIAARSGRPESRHAIRKVLAALGLKRRKKPPS